MLLAIVSVQICVKKGFPSSRLDKKQTINLWKRHMLCDSVLIYGRNCWEFEHFVSPASVQSCVAKFPLRTVWMKILEMKTTRTQLCSRNFLFPRSPSSLAFRLFIVWNLDSFHEIFFRGARIRRTRKKKKKKNTNKNTTMTRAPANFFRKCVYESAYWKTDHWKRTNLKQ